MNLRLHGSSSKKIEWNSTHARERQSYPRIHSRQSTCRRSELYRNCNISVENSRKNVFVITKRRTWAQSFVAAFRSSLTTKDFSGIFRPRCVNETDKLFFGHNGFCLVPINWFAWHQTKGKIERIITISTTSNGWTLKRMLSIRRNGN